MRSLSLGLSLGLGVRRLLRANFHETSSSAQRDESNKYWKIQFVRVLASEG